MTRRVRRPWLAGLALAGALAGLGLASRGHDPGAALDAPAAAVIVSCLACHDGLLSVVPVARP